MLFELVNPCDPYTLRADEDRVAAMAALLLGHGKVMARRVEPPDECLVCPALAFASDGGEAWLLATFAPDPRAWLDAHRSAVGEALRSVMIGSPSSRREAEAAMERMSPSDAVEYARERHDRMRTSMADLRRCAEVEAARLEDRSGGL